MQKNHSLVEQFSHFLKQFIDGHLSAETKRAYGVDLKDFYHFIKKIKPTYPNESIFTVSTFALYRDHLLNKRLSSSTINRKMVAIRSFCKWCVANGHIPNNPLDIIKLPKATPNSPTIAFTDDEARQLIDAPDVSTKKGSAHRLLLALLINLGLRRNEVVNLKLKDLHDDRGHLVLRVHGKGQKIRSIPLNDIAQLEIENYLARWAFFGHHPLCGDDYLVQLGKGISAKPIDGSTVYRIVRRYANLCGMAKKVGAHSCRATVISHLLDTAKVPIRDVADFAGHSNVNTTERYDKKRKGLDDNASYKVMIQKQIK